MNTISNCTVKLVSSYLPYIAIVCVHEGQRI